MFIKTIWYASLSTIAAVLLGLLAFRTGLLEFRPAFSLFVLGLAAGVLVWVVAVITVLAAKIRGKAVDGRLIRAAAMSGLPALAVFLLVGSAGFKAPMIHDISTDMDNPPSFNLALADRAGSENSVEYEGERVAAEQRLAYPKIKTLRVRAPATEVMAEIKMLVQQQGWRELGVSDDGMQLEAVASTAFMGFKDDIVFRVVTVDNETSVDIRSLSRVGIGDFGANASRVRIALEALKKRFE